MNSHSAIGPALGYYYQSIFALISLFDSQNDSSYVSIETFDDVYHEDGMIKTLHQLKHKTTVNATISIKDDDLWKTIKVWCDFAIISDPKNGLFTLSTVATIDNSSPLNILKTEREDRKELEALLLEEAKRVINKREEIRKENQNRIKNSKKENSLPFGSKYKGCEAFLALTPLNRKALLNNSRINTEIFSISEAQSEVIKRIRINTQSKNYTALAESIIAWWDREAVRSLTRERKECIYLSELQEFISKKNAELYNDGFTDDIDDIEIPQPDFYHPIHKKQLEIINATATQKRRSFNTEVKARIQRDIWMRNNFPSASKLKKYDESLIEEWSYKFGEIEEKSTEILEEEKKEQGRDLLDWSHNEANSQVKKISEHYNNPDLIRGSYQILSKDKRVGWHCDYDSLIEPKDEDK